MQGNVSTNPVAAVPQAAPTTSVLSSIWNNVKLSPQGILGYFAIVLGIVLIVIAKASNMNEVAKDNTLTGGSLSLVAGLLLLVITKEGIASFTAWRANTPGKTWLLFALVLAITIAIFTLLFYNFAPTETLPFASAVLITLTVIGIVGTLYTYAGRDVLAAATTRFLFALYFFLPYALFVFGFVIDAMNKKLEYIPASFSGLTGILFNYALGVILDKGVATPATNALCEIPGLSLLSSTLVPQPMMFTLTILAHIATYISRSKVSDGSLKFANDAGSIWPSWVLYFSVFALHSAILLKNNCITDNKRLIWGLLLPLAYGGITGAIQSATLGREGFTDAAGIEKFISEGFDAIQLPIREKPKEGDKKMTSTSSEPEVATCAKGAKDGEFVCESFENGVLKSQVMTE